MLNESEKASIQDFRVLGLEPDSSPSQVKKAYREQVKHWHPDYFQQRSASERKRAEEKLKEITTAYRHISLGWKSGEAKKSDHETRPEPKQETGSKGFSRTSEAGKKKGSQYCSSSLAKAFLSSLKGQFHARFPRGKRSALGYWLFFSCSYRPSPSSVSRIGLVTTPKARHRKDYRNHNLEGWSSLQPSPDQRKPTPGPKARSRMARHDPCPPRRRKARLASPATPPRPTSH